MANTDRSEKIGLARILTYAQAQIGLDVCLTLLGLHLLYFYTDRRGLSPALAGLAMFLALFLDALSDPLVGNISDHAQFRSGRRRPFFFAALPMGVCFFLLFTPPALNSGLFVWFFVLYLLMLTSRKIYETAYSALMPELTLDYDERTRLSTFRQLAATLGDIAGALLPFAAMYLFRPPYDFQVSSALSGMIVAGGAMLVYLTVAERPEFIGRQRLSLVESVKSAARNRPFVILLTATALAVMAVNIPTVLFRFLAKYWAHDESLAAGWLAAYFLGAMLSYPFWLRLTVRIGKKRAFIAAMLMNAAASTLWMVPSASDRLVFYPLMGLGGFAGVGTWVIQMSAAADVIEWDEERTGRRQEGAYAGLTSMAFKIAAAATMLLVGPLLGWIGYQPGGNGTMSGAAGESLRQLFAIVPAAIFLLAALVFTRYPITREYHRRMLERLSERRVPASGTSESPTAAGGVLHRP